jgi:menaquinone-dependent protoporphyrinogen oxidase
MKILVTAASKHGATAEIADWIAEALRADGMDADRRSPESVDGIGEYDAVVLGSAIYAGRWLEAARRFSQRHHAPLRGVPVWLFSSGPIGDPLTPTEEPSDGARLRNELDTRAHRTFPGRIDPSELSWVERTITGMLRAPDGDYRDRDEVEAWAHVIAAGLAPVEAVR